MGTIYFARHGQASFGSSNYDSLCDRGIEQSRALGDHLVRLGLSFDAVYSGEMERQKQTAYEVAAAFAENRLGFPEVQIISALNEFDFSKIMKILLPGILENDPSLEDDIPNLFTDNRAFIKIVDMIVARWLSGKYDLGELEWDVFKDRIRNGIKKIIKENGRNKNIIVFSSGGPISAVVQMVLDITDEMTAKLCWQIYNASLSRFVYNSKGVTLSSFNNITHFELDRDKDLITYR